MFLRAAIFLGFSLVNPLCMAAAFVVCQDMDVYGAVGGNEAQFDVRFFPVYLAIGVVVQFLQILLVHAVARRKYPGRNITLAEAADAFLFAQRPFVVFVLFLFMLLDRIEGNVVAFSAIYAFPFVILTALLVNARLFRRLKSLVDQTTRQATTGLRAIAGASALAVVSSLAVIWIYGPVNAFGHYLAWRSDTPQYAVRRVVEAVRAGRMDEVQKYVDIDTILSQFAAVGGPTKAELAAALADGRVTTDADGNVTYNEWRIQLVGDGGDRLAWIREKGGEFTAQFCLESHVTGQSLSLVFAMEKTHGSYRLTRVTSMSDVVQLLNERDTLVRKMPALAEEARAKAGPRVAVRLHGMRIDDGRLLLQFDVANKGPRPITRLQCAVILKRTDTGAMALAATVWPSLYPGHLAAGKAQTMDDSTYVSPTVAASLEAKRLVVADVFPISVEYDNDHREDLVELPDGIAEF